MSEDAKHILSTIRSTANMPERVYIMSPDRCKAVTEYVDRLQAERDEFWGQMHMKEGENQRLKKNISDIAASLRHPMKSQDELSPEDAVGLAKYLRMISETAIKTLKLLDDHGIWTGADDDIYDRVHLVVTDHGHFKREYYKLHAALKDIHEMAAEDIRTEEAAGCTWQIEANARAALGLKVEE